MNTQAIQLTKIGLETLKNELVKLESIELPMAIRVLEEARLKSTDQDSNELTEARDKVDFLLVRLNELKLIISRATLTEELPKDNTIVNLGDTVRVKISEVIHEYRIVSSLEANPLSGFISAESPIGQALMNSRAGEEMSVMINNNEIGIAILEII